MQEDKNFKNDFIIIMAHEMATVMVDEWSIAMMVRTMGVCLACKVLKMKTCSRNMVLKAYEFALIGWKRGLKN